MPADLDGMWAPDPLVTIADVFAIDDQVGDLMFLSGAICERAKGLRFLGSSLALHGLHCVRTWCARGVAPRIVLIDLNMPVIGGLDLLRDLKDLPATAAVPVALWTASLCPKDHIKARQLGAVEVFVKPFGREAMGRFARDLFERIRRPEDDDPTRAFTRPV
ncbi:MAG: response regulator [Planctomycetes bacterium]|nr:response regulator [Planctomycetota bacterium]